MENNNWIIAIAVIAVVAIVAVFGMVTMTGYAIKTCDIVEHCPIGEVWSDKACKCIPESKGKADMVIQCQTRCGIAPGRQETIIEEVLVDSILQVKGVIVEELSEGTCDSCRDGCNNQPDMCVMMLCELGVPSQTCCENQGLTWCPVEAEKETACMQECLGVGSGQIADCFAGTGCTTLDCCPGYQGLDCIMERCEGFDTHMCKPDCLQIVR